MTATAEYPSTIEFFQCNDTTPWTKRTELRNVQVSHSLTLTLDYHTAGYQVAGSAAIWRPESWRVGRLFKGCASGQYFSTAAAAEWDFTERQIAGQKAGR
jgi:hypothetical protein